VAQRGGGIVSSTAAAREAGCFHRSADECDCARCYRCDALGGLTRDMFNEELYCEDCADQPCEDCEQRPCMCGAGDALEGDR